MGIQPPSDLVLDVMQAADAVRARQVTSKLQALSSGAPADFGAALAKAEASDADTTTGKIAARAAAAKAAALIPAGLAFSGATLTNLRNAHALSQRPAAAAGAVPPANIAAFKKFEAMALTQFLDAMMPDNAGVFGGGTAGRSWKSLLTEKLGAHVAEGGGLGIAARLAHASAAFSLGTKKAEG